MTTRPRLLGTLWRFRFVLAAVCLTSAGLLILSDLAPPQPTGTLTVAARDLPAGTEVTSGDLRERPALNPPAAALTAEELIGQTLAAGVPEDLPVAATMVVSSGLVDAAPPGTVVVPVQLADPQLMTLVRVGDRLRLYQPPSWESAELDPGGSGAELVADDALVLARLDAGEDASGLLDVGGAQASGAVVVAISPDAATVLSGAGALTPVRAVLIPGDQP
ncbi:SAF domain-containing protein [Ruania suaedae]|uniref:SAF domain-containing protein n=1 Tax=Ruania suaedae TaxID=2897774 RepID=UPI001E41B90C|nr:SAF domain-containing protein [Ruania suaedae]UFU03632.1 SAF domain-containing protein [Ruania suaedae]